MAWRARVAMQKKDNGAGTGKAVVSGLEAFLLAGDMCPEHRQDLMRRMCFERFEPKQRLFAMKDPGDRVYVVDRGAVKIVRERRLRQKRLEMILGPGDVVGLYPVLSAEPRDSSAVAASWVTAASIECTELPSDGEAQLALMLSMQQHLCRRLRVADARRVDMKVLDGPARLAKLLLLLSARFGVAEYPVPRIELALNRTELGQLIGVSRETLVKTLAQFAERGWVAKKSKAIDLLRPKELAKRARPDMSIMD